MKVKEKILAIFPWSGKKSQQRERERTTESSPREEKTRGKRRGWGGWGRKKGRVKPQGSKVTQYFIHRTSPE